ncbi:MAG: PAS domain S-box protein [Acidobacteria bacterium]|nr:PAS domain S-box protein [Acidobacteriota bacterium]
MGKTLSEILTYNRNLLKNQILSGGYSKSNNQMPQDDHLVKMVNKVLDLLIDNTNLVKSGEFSHKFLEITTNNHSQSCIPGLGPALSTLRTTIFSLLAKESPQDDWPIYYLRLSNAIDAYLLNDSTLVENLTQSLDNANRLLEVEAQSKREASINAINRAISSSLELSEIIKTAALELGQVLKVSNLAVYRATSEKILMLEHEFCLSERVHDLLISLENPLIKKAVEIDQALVIDDTEVELTEPSLSASLQWLKSRAKVTSCLLNPIFLNGRIWGLFYLTQENKRKWTQNDISLVIAIADQLTIAIRQAELFAEVARANREWTTTFDAMSDAIFILDRHKFLRRANQSAIRFLGKSFSPIIGADSADLHPIFRDTQNLLAQVISTGQRKKFEQPYGTPPRDLVITADPIKTPEGESLGAVCILRDVTDIRQVEAEAHTQRQFFASLIENAYDAIYTLDKNGDVTWANPRIQNMLGHSPAELHKKSIFTILPEDQIELARAAFQTALEGEPKIHEQLFRRSDGSLCLTMVTYSPLFVSGKITGVLAIARDVTQERRASEIAAHTDKLHALGQMASGVAHDFNNVLATILGRTQLLKRMAETEQIRRGLEIIETATLDGASTARRIQNFARLNPTNAEFKSINLNQLISDCLEFTSTRWNSDAHARGINFDVTTSLGEDVISRGDPSELREVFVNLIFNAIDAMPKGGKLHISTYVEASQATVKLTDSGIGMSEEIKQRIFEPFFTTKGASGTGLGLSVSLSIISHHGGTIEIDSEIGKGTSFYVRLPLAKAEILEVPTTRPIAEPMPEAQMLIVDDEDSVREVLADMLDIFGHSVVQCASAQAGLQALKEEKFDIIFTDLAMPDMDGWALAEQVRQKWPTTKIILMTGYGADTSPENQAKVDAIISKPFDIEQLQETLTNLLRS